MLKKEGEFGLIFDIQRFSLHDGPGIRTNIYMKGCPLRCPWCCNPESQEAKPEIMFRASNCAGYGKCVEVCPSGAIAIAGGKATNNWELCSNDCVKCVAVCPNDARRLAGNYATVDDVLKEIKKDELFYRNSGGGVTITGGEPTAQPEFVVKLLQKCQAEGIHTAIETCGYTRWENLEKILKYCDLVLYDIKHMDDRSHKQTLGVSNKLILENLKKCAIANETIIRVPVIPGFNDSEIFMKELSRFARGLNSIEKIDLLPYHRLGLQKYGMLNRVYPWTDELPDTVRLTEYKKIIEACGLAVELY